MRSIFYTIVVWSCIIGSAEAQTQQYLFSYLGLKDGLLADNIRGVQQDADGFIWIASHNALQRFDGQRFLNFYQDPSGKSSMPAGGIRGIQIDKKNRLWVLSGTNSVGYFDVSNFTYKSVSAEPPTEKAKQASVALYIDRDDNVLLIFVGHGYLTYDEKTGGFSAVNNPFIIPDGWEPLYLFQCADRNYWSGSHNGLLKYNPVKKKLSYRGHNTEEDPVISHFGYARTVVFATVDRSGRFWIASWPDNVLQIKSFTTADNQETDWFRIIRNSIGDKYFELQGITEMSDGSLWMGGINLFAKINATAKTIQPIFSNASEEYSIRYDHVFSVYEDKEKNAWVCTNEGVFRFNPGAQLFKGVVNRSKHNPSSFTSDVTDILETADKKILVSTWGNGVFAYDMKFNPAQSDYADRSTVHGEGMVWCMIQRDNGDIWKGLQSGGLNIYEAASRKTRKLHPPVFEGSTIRQIAVDKKGNIWLGTQRGHIVKWDVTTNTFTLQLRLQAIVGRIYIDDRNYVWICTDKNGVYEIDTDGKIEFRYNDNGPAGKSLRINGAGDIIQYNDSLYLIAADGLNILNVRTRQFTYMVGQKNGLPLAHINNIVKDKDGYVWLSTGAGIVSYQPITGKLSRYDASDGIHTNSFSVASSVALRDGRIAFGTSHDLIVFDPAKVTVRDYIPPAVTIAGFSVMNKSMRPDSIKQLRQINLNYFEHSVTIQLSTLTFQNTFDIYYQMEGLDKEWVPAGRSNLAIFNYLQPGTYFFKAACKDAAGKMGQITTLKIRLYAPFWQAWWFYSLLAILVVALIFWADRIRIRNIYREQQIRSSIASNLHEDVHTTLQNINVLSEIAGFKADENPEQSKGYIHDIKHKSRNMVVAMGDVLWSIDPANDDMNKTISRIYEHIESLRIKHQAVIEVRIDPKIQKMKLDMKRRHEFMVVFKLALTNLVEIFQSPHTIVQLDLAKKILTLNIYSAQKSYHKSNHIVIKNINEMKKRAANINASLDVQNDESSSYVLLEVKI